MWHLYSVSGSRSQSDSNILPRLRQNGMWFDWCTRWKLVNYKMKMACGSGGRPPKKLQEAGIYGHPTVCKRWKWPRREKIWYKPQRKTTCGTCSTMVWWNSVERLRGTASTRRVCVQSAWHNPFWAQPVRSEGLLIYSLLKFGCQKSEFSCNGPKCFFNSMLTWYQNPNNQNG